MNFRNWLARPKNDDFEQHRQRAQDFMANSGINKDLIVINTREDWYKDRFQQASKLAATAHRRSLYRCIAAESLEKINMKKLGIHWSEKIAGAQCYWARQKRPDVSNMFVLEGHITGQDSVDREETILNFLVPHYENEREVRLKPGQLITITKVWSIQQNGLLAINGWKPQKGTT